LIPLLNKIDIPYIGVGRCSLFRYGIRPNKLFDYMMTGKPIIQAIEAANNIVREAKCGISVKGEDPIFIAEAIKYIVELKRDEREEMDRRGREYVIRNHSYEVLAKDFLESVMNE